MKNGREKEYFLGSFLASEKRKNPVKFWITVEFWITMQFEASKWMPFDWIAKQLVLSLRRSILLHAWLDLTTISLSNSYFASKKTKVTLNILTQSFNPCLKCIYSLLTLSQINLIKPHGYAKTEFLRLLSNNQQTAQNRQAFPEMNFRVRSSIDGTIRRRIYSLKTLLVHYPITKYKVKFVICKVLDAIL